MKDEPHLGHHIIATIAVHHLIVGWDNDKQVPIWKEDAPKMLRDCVLDFAVESVKKPKK